MNTAKPAQQPNFIPHLDFVMVDLETLGTTAGSMILSIGAVWVLGGEIQERFYRVITTESQPRLTIDAETVKWWLRQGDDARQSLLCSMQTPGAVRLAEALEDFADHFYPAEREIWANGASFDFPILGAAYAKHGNGVEVPWRYSDERCYRTLKRLLPHITPDAPPAAAVKHHALHDAEYQARHLVKILSSLHADLAPDFDLSTPSTPPAEVSIF